MKSSLFYAEVAKGYIPKVVFDGMATNLSKIPIKISKKGMFIRVADKEETMYAHSMWNTMWVRKKFAKYKCEKTETISVNVKHLQKMLKNVKKKDSLVFRIAKNDPDKLRIIIQPSGTRSAGSSVKAETISLSIQRVKVVPPNLPDKLEKDGETYETYGNPMVITASDFQKIKKMTSVCKTTITVKIQKDNYISFRVGDDKVIGSHLEFGELTENPEDSDVETEESGDNEEENNEVEENDDEEDDAENEDDEDDEEDENECMYPCIYEKEFNISMFSPLVKLPGMCTQMEFYAPKYDFFPLKVNVAASSGLGDTTIYIKDKACIEAVETKKGKK